MSAVEALNTARAVGVEVRVDGDFLILEAATPPPEEVIDLLSRHKPALVALLRPGMDERTADDWRAFFNERAAITDFDGGPSRVATEARAFAACVIEWLNRNPVRSSADRCCWCAGAERRDNVLLPFGSESRGHAWLHSECWRPWHEHRQARAIDFLRAVGITAPSDLPKDFAKNGGA